MLAERCFIFVTTRFSKRSVDGSRASRTSANGLLLTVSQGHGAGLRRGLIYDPRNARTPVKVLHATHVAFRHGISHSGARCGARDIALLVRYDFPGRRIETIGASVFANSTEPACLEMPIAHDVKPIRIVRRPVRPATAVARILRRISVHRHNHAIRNRSTGADGIVERDEVLHEYIEHLAQLRNGAFEARHVLERRLLDGP